MLFLEKIFHIYICGIKHIIIEILFAHSKLYVSYFSIFSLNKKWTRLFSYLFNKIYFAVNLFYILYYYNIYKILKYLIETIIITNFR